MIGIFFTDFNVTTQQPILRALRHITLCFGHTHFLSLAWLRRDSDLIVLRLNR